MEEVVFWLKVLCGIVTVASLFGGYYLRYVRTLLHQQLETESALLVEFKQQMLNEIVLSREIVTAIVNPSQMPDITESLAEDVNDDVLQTS